MSEPIVRIRRWSRWEYERLAELGIFDEDEPIELLDGDLIVCEPKRSRHEAAVALAHEALRRAFGGTWVVRVGAPLALGDRSEPEPDLSVVPGAPRDYRDGHPLGAALVVEVAETSHALDRGPKAAIYARNEIAEYWIVDVVAGALEVYREPSREGYRRVARLEPGMTIAPLAAPSAPITVADLLP